jgi:hypothetical protein
LALIWVRPRKVSSLDIVLYASGKGRHCGCAVLRSCGSGATMLRIALSQTRSDNRCSPRRTASTLPWRIRPASSRESSTGAEAACLERFAVPPGCARRRKLCSTVEGSRTAGGCDCFPVAARHSPSSPATRLPGK